MRKLKLIILFLAITFLLSGCYVSQNKYDDLENDYELAQYEMKEYKFLYENLYSHIENCYISDDYFSDYEDAAAYAYSYIENGSGSAGLAMDAIDYLSKYISELKNLKGY